MDSRYTLRKAFSNAAICYTLVTLSLSIAFYIIADLSTQYAPDLNNLLLVLGYSLVLGFSGYFFNIKRWTAAPKRICHIAINFAAFLLFYYLSVGEFVLSQMMAGTFLFFAAYLVCVGIAALCRLIARRFRSFMEK